MLLLGIDFLFMQDVTLTDDAVPLLDFLIVPAGDLAWGRCNLPSVILSLHIRLHLQVHSSNYILCVQLITVNLNYLNLERFEFLNVMNS